ncbi:cytochrome P450 [Streptomyces sp. WAC 06738]|jgi:oxidation protein CepF/oxidation protein CepG|uniref:cytochrome P450 n=1 Tax=Streptomyces sp. WAC 06738 TaxID=2203210 RepID=UPI000F706AB3|nr:cytochrome P450 [Streptomyces sp. WAC 06738]AZM50113.1 cytochrome P450 [Streptomyces sp. WAC 06738]
MPRRPGPAPAYTRRTRFDPAAELRAIAAERPVTRIDVGPGDSEEYVWLVTGYDEVRQVLGDHVRFSTRRRFGRAARADGTYPDDHRPDDMIGQLMDYDPPEHTRLRKMLTPEFTVRRIRRLRPRIEEIVAGRLDAVERAGPPADLVEQFATPVSGAVLCELIGVPRDDRDAFLRRARHHLDQGRGRQARAAAGAAFSRYLAALIAGQRRDPDDGFLGMLVRDHGTDVTDKELRGVCVLLMLAGLDNVSGMLSLGTLVLLEHPGRLAEIRADPGAVDRTVDELLRYLTVPHAPTPRTALEDVTVGGQLVRAGEHVVVSLPTANRDPALTADPDRFDPAREPAAHLAFGHGIHHCLGAALARMELGIGYTALLRRFPHLRLAAPAAEVPFRLHTTAYGLERLPVAW